MIGKVQEENAEFINLFIKAFDALTLKDDYAQRKKEILAGLIQAFKEYKNHDFGEENIYAQVNLNANLMRRELNRDPKMTA